MSVFLQFNNQTTVTLHLHDKETTLLLLFVCYGSSHLKSDGDQQACYVTMLHTFKLISN
jgi:hypothetical protein